MERDVHNLDYVVQFQYQKWLQACILNMKKKEREKKRLYTIYRWKKIYEQEFYLNETFVLVNQCN